MIQFFENQSELMQVILIFGVSASMLFTIFGIFVVYKLFTMPEFKKKLPEREKWFEKHKYELNIYMILFQRDDKVISKQIYTYTIVAYVLVRLLAVYQDIKTIGSYKGVLWEYVKKENTLVE